MHASINPSSTHAPTNHPCSHPCADPTLHLPTFPLIYPCTHPCTHPPISPFTRATTHLPVHAPTQCIHPFMHPIHLYINPCTYPTIHPPMLQVLHPSLQERDGHGPQSRPALSQHCAALFLNLHQLPSEELAIGTISPRRNQHLNINGFLKSQVSKPAPLCTPWLANQVLGCDLHKFSQGPLS